jgi:signal transduction histidine kinase
VKGREEHLLNAPLIKGRHYGQTSEGVLAAAAHELKAPLVLIKHLAQSLDDPNLVGDPKKSREYLERIQLTVNRSLRFVQHLTLSYRLDSNMGKAPFEFALEPLSMNKVCADALDEMRPYAHHHGQQLRLAGLNCPHLVLANQDILHDIVVNLVDNALQHNPNGSVVEVAAECRGEHVRLAVRDEGGAVTRSEFNELRRNIGSQPQPLSGRPGTSGLGLYIIQQFATAMGGSLGLGRSAGNATFFVDLLRSKQMSLLP